MKMVGLIKISNGAATGSEEERAAESSSVCGGVGQAPPVLVDAGFGCGQG